MLSLLCFQHEAESDVAHAFPEASYEARRDWAKYEIEASKRMAEYTREIIEEIFRA